MENDILMDVININGNSAWREQNIAYHTECYSGEIYHGIRHQSTSAKIRNFRRIESRIAAVPSMQSPTTYNTYTVHAYIIWMN